MSTGRAARPYGATPDVERTVAWLESAGFELFEARGPEGMGFQLLGYQRGDGARVRVRSDRSQWMAELRLAGWDRWFDLDIVVDAITGRTRWDASVRSPLARQLPPDVEWLLAVPDALAWAAATPDAPRLLDDLQHERARQLFP